MRFWSVSASVGGDQRSPVGSNAGPEIGHTWRSRRDSLALFTPARYDALPGMAFPGAPGTYPGKDAAAAYLTAHATAFSLPVRLNARVTWLSKTAEGFEIHLQVEIFRARRVVVATGPFQAPYTPPAAQRPATALTARGRPALASTDDDVGGAVARHAARSGGCRNCSRIAPGPLPARSR